MAFTRNARRLHRRLGTVLGIQLFLWTMSGLYFVWSDLDAIHGDPWRREAEAIPFSDAWVAPSDVDFAGAGLDRPGAIEELAVVDVLGVPHYRIGASDGTVVLADARTGAIRGPLDEDEAVAMARASFAPDADVRSVARLTQEDVGPHHEYRGGALPAWCVTFDHETGTRVYVAANQGEVTRHRNTSWRIFDFLWMLHTMDYLTRDDFNTPWIRAIASIALLAIVSGFVLWLRTQPRGARR